MGRRSALGGCLLLAAGASTSAAASPQVYWRYDSGVNSLVKPPAVSRDAVFAAGITGFIARLDKGSGDVVWRANHSAVTNSNPRLTLDGSGLLVGDNAGYLTNWGTLSGSVTWAANLLAPVHGTPGVTPTGHVAVAAGSSVAMLAPGNGQPLWRQTVDSRILSWPLVNGSAGPAGFEMV